MNSTRCHCRCLTPSSGSPADTITISSLCPTSLAGAGTYHHMGNPPAYAKAALASPMLLPCLPVIPVCSAFCPAARPASYFSLCWCNNLKSHNKATYGWHWLGSCACSRSRCLTITIFLWIWLLARIDCKTLPPSPQMCSSSQVHTSLHTHPVSQHVSLP